MPRERKEQPGPMIVDIKSNNPLSLLPLTYRAKIVETRGLITFHIYQPVQGPTLTCMVNSVWGKQIEESLVYGWNLKNHRKLTVWIPRLQILGRTHLFSVTKSFFFFLFFLQVFVGFPLFSFQCFSLPFLFELFTFCSFLATVVYYY